MLAAATNGEHRRLTNAGAAAWWTMWALVSDILAGTVRAVSSDDHVTFMRPGCDPIVVTWASVRDDAPVGEPASLFDVGQAAVERPTARTTDGRTSWAAARGLDAKSVGTRCGEALAVIALAGERGATNAEVTAALGRDRGNTAKRVSDLLALGLVEDAGHERPGPTGRMQRVVRVTRVGRGLVEREGRQEAS